MPADLRGILQKSHLVYEPSGICSLEDDATKRHYMLCFTCWWCKETFCMDCTQDHLKVKHIEVAGVEL